MPFAQSYQSGFGRPVRGSNIGTSGGGIRLRAIPIDPCYICRMFKPLKNPSDVELTALIRASRHCAARRIVDPRSGDQWCWPAEQATHREAADILGIHYDRQPGEGDIITI
jgi:hypothetical protein